MTARPGRAGCRTRRQRGDETPFYHTSSIGFTGQADHPHHPTVSGVVDQQRQRQQYRSRRRCTVAIVGSAQDEKRAGAGRFEPDWLSPSARG